MTPELQTLIKQAAQEHETQGWTDPDRCVRMAELVLETKPELVVELGVFGGRSLIPQAMALRENGRGKIVGVDPWKLAAALEGENPDNQKWWQEQDIDAVHTRFMQVVWRHNMDAWVVVVRSAAQDVVGLFKDIDILNIDGNHSEIASMRDVRQWVPLVRSGGHIWMDDCDWPSTQAAVKQLESMTTSVYNGGNFRLFRKA